MVKLSFEVYTQYYSVAGHKLKFCIIIIILQPAFSCEEYPVIEYLVSLSSKKSEENNTFNVINSTAATQVSTVLDLQDLNQLYQYRVIAVNTIGRVTSDENYFSGFIIVPKNITLHYVTDFQ